MGSSESKELEACGYLYVEVANVTINAGQTIEGIVHLDLRKPFLCRNLILRFEGYEKTKWNKRE